MDNSVLSLDTISCLAGVSRGADACSYGGERQATRGVEVDRRATFNVVRNPDPRSAGPDTFSSACAQVGFDSVRKFPHTSAIIGATQRSWVLSPEPIPPYERVLLWRSHFRPPLGGHVGDKPCSLRRGRLALTFCHEFKWAPCLNFLSTPVAP